MGRHVVMCAATKFTGRAPIAQIRCMDNENLPQVGAGSLKPKIQQSK